MDSLKPQGEIKNPEIPEEIPREEIPVIPEAPPAVPDEREKIAPVEPELIIEEPKDIPKKEDNQGTQAKIDFFDVSDEPLNTLRQAAKLQDEINLVI